MNDRLRAWVNEALREREAAQVALQNGDDAPMKTWALRYGADLVAKVGELAGALDAIPDEHLHNCYSHRDEDGPVLGDCHPACWVPRKRSALRAPGGWGVVIQGTIQRYYTAWCGYPGCTDRADLDMENTMRQAERTIREYGWRKTRDYGWVCPAHSTRSSGGVDHVD